VDEGMTKLLAEVRAYRQQLTLHAKSRTVNVPGRVDLTGLRAFAIDLPGTHIYEDAISYNATSKELLVHIPEAAPWFQKCWYVDAFDDADDCLSMSAACS
jgi:hypothetical protein